VIGVKKRFRIHLFGSSGSGSTTLAKAISLAHDFHFIDVDDIFWEPTDPPFTRIKPKSECLEQLRNLLEINERAAVSGAFVGWGDSLKPLFDLFVFMHLPLEIRLERIKIREQNRFGNRVLPGGDLYKQHLDFLDWVSLYETGDINMRSKAQHEAWLKDVNVPIIRITEAMSIPEMLKLILPYLDCESERL
jgi:adenylate kinase family enzyme